MPNILIVAEIKNHLLMSVTEHLKKQSYAVIPVAADTDAINGCKETLSGILIYADETLIEQQQALFYLKDRALADGIPVFAIGTPEELQSIRKLIPADVLNLTFARPITEPVSSMMTKIDKSIKLNSLQKKILVVDDSGTMLHTVKGWLEHKYNVLLANSGAMAIKYLSLNRPDLILLDYDMPVVDGKLVLEMIRTETDFADIPVIFLTARGDRESIMNVQALKPEGYLLKSLDPPQIITAIDNFFEVRKASANAAF